MLYQVNLAAYFTTIDTSLHLHMPLTDCRGCFERLLCRLLSHTICLNPWNLRAGLLLNPTKKRNFQNEGLGSLS